MLRLTRTYVVRTPKSCQDRKVAAVRDAFDRRRLRVTFFGDRAIALPISYTQATRLGGHRALTSSNHKAMLKQDAPELLA